MLSLLLTASFVGLFNVEVVSATTVFTTDLEDYLDFDGVYDGSSVTTEISSDYSYVGDYCSKRVISTSSYREENPYYEFDRTYSALYASCWIYYPSASLSAFDSSQDSISIIGFYSTASTQNWIGLAKIRATATNTTIPFWSISYRNGGGWHEDYADTCPSADTWHFVELYVEVGDGGCSYLYVDGVEVCSVTGIDNNDRGDLAGIWVHGLSNGISGFVDFIDKVEVSTTSVSFVKTVFATDLEDYLDFDGIYDAGGVTVAIDSSYYYVGEYSSKRVISTDFYREENPYYGFGITYSALYASCYVYIPSESLPLLDTNGRAVSFIGFYSTASTQSWIGLAKLRPDTSDPDYPVWNIDYRDDGGWYQSYASWGPEGDEWYFIELYVEVGISGCQRMYVDGVEVCNATDIDNDDRGDLAGVFIHGMSNYVDGYVDYIDAVTVDENFILDDEPPEYGVRWHELFDIHAFYDALEAYYPSYVSHEIIGYSDVYSEPIYVYKIGNLSSNKILIDGCIHGEEQVAAEITAMYAGWILTNGTAVANYTRDNSYTFFIPVLNVDGYPDNRKNGDGGSGDVDLCYNFEYNWGQSPDGSSDPSSWKYHGASAESENETQVMRNLWDSYSFVNYVEMHTGQYSQGCPCISYCIADEPYYTWIQDVLSRYNETAEALGYSPYPSMEVTDNGTPVMTFYVNQSKPSYLCELSGEWGYPEDYCEEFENILYSFLPFFNTLQSSPYMYEVSLVAR